MLRNLSYFTEWNNISKQKFYKTQNTCKNIFSSIAICDRIILFISAHSTQNVHNQYYKIVMCIFIINSKCYAIHYLKK